MVDEFLANAIGAADLTAGARLIVTGGELAADLSLSAWVVTYGSVGQPSQGLRRRSTVQGMYGSSNSDSHCQQLRVPLRTFRFFAGRSSMAH